MFCLSLLLHYSSRWVLLSQYCMLLNPKVFINWLFRKEKMCQLRPGVCPEQFSFIWVYWKQTSEGQYFSVFQAVSLLGVKLDDRTSKRGHLTQLKNHEKIPRSKTFKYFQYPFRYELPFFPRKFCFELEST